MSDKSLVVYCKISREDYNSLTIKDEDTLYAVNDNGDFSMANLNDSAELYLGNKKLSPTIVGTTGQSTTSVMHQKAVTDAINGLQSDIDAKSKDFYGECNISPSTVAKTVATLNGGFVLKKGAKVSVKFLQGHTASTMTLNVDGTGAKSVYRNGSNPSSTMIKSFNVYDFVYDGTYWRIVGVDTDTTYSNATQSANGLMSSADKKKLDSLGKSLTVNNVVYDGTSEKTVEASYYLPKYSKGVGSSVQYLKFLTITPASVNYTDTNYEFIILGRNNVRCEVRVFVRAIANKKYISTSTISSYGTKGLISAFMYRDSSSETDRLEIWVKLPTYDTIKIFPKTLYYNNILGYEYVWDSNTLYNALPTDYTSKIDVLELFTADKVKNALTINHNGTTKTYDGSSAVTIDIASGGSSSGESSIQPFAGFMTGEDMSNIVDQSSNLTGGQVYCSQSKNRFYYKVNGLFYGGFPNASLYHDNYNTSSATAKTGAIFSYNGKHYTMYNGTLQDMSVLDDNGNMTTAGIVKLSDSTTGSSFGINNGVAATPKAVASVATTARNYTDSKASQTLESANQYTDEQIAAKILLVPELPENPIAGVLYCIPE